MGVEYYDKGGRALDMLEWVLLFENAEYKRVALDELPGGKVSTVWLGLNHQFAPDGPPHIFETLVFGGPLDGEQDRYSTEEEARLGHQAMVEKLKARHAIEGQQ